MAIRQRTCRSLRAVAGWRHRVLRTAKRKDRRPLARAAPCPMAALSPLLPTLEGVGASAVVMIPQRMLQMVRVQLASQDAPHGQKGWQLQLEKIVVVCGGVLDTVHWVVVQLVQRLQAARQLPQQAVGHLLAIGVPKMSRLCSTDCTHQRLP